MKRLFSQEGGGAGGASGGSGPEERLLATLLAEMCVELSLRSFYS